MTQETAAATQLKVPEVLKIEITPQAYELIRGLLGQQPFDKVQGLCAQIDHQVGEQIRAFNAPASAQPEPAAANTTTFGNRSVRRSAVKKSGNVTALNRAKADAPANT